MRKFFEAFKEGLGLGPSINIYDPTEDLIAPAEIDQLNLSNFISKYKRMPHVRWDEINYILKARIKNRGTMLWAMTYLCTKWLEEIRESINEKYQILASDHFRTIWLFFWPHRAFLSKRQVL